MDDDIDECTDAVIAPDHKIMMRDDGEGYVLRIERPSGSGRPLYETLTLSAVEAEALLQVLMDTVG